MNPQYIYKLHWYAMKAFINHDVVGFHAFRTERYYAKLGNARNRELWNAKPIKKEKQ